MQHPKSSCPVYYFPSYGTLRLLHQKNTGHSQLWDFGTCSRRATLLSPAMQALVLDVQKAHFLGASHTSHPVQEMARLAIDGDLQAIILDDDERWTAPSGAFTTLRD